MTTITNNVPDIGELITAHSEGRLADYFPETTAKELDPEVLLTTGTATRARLLAERLTSISTFHPPKDQNIIRSSKRVTATEIVEYAVVDLLGKWEKAHGMSRHKERHDTDGLRKQTAVKLASAQQQANEAEKVRLESEQAKDKAQARAEREAAEALKLARQALQSAERTATKVGIPLHGAGTHARSQR